MEACLDQNPDFRETQVSRPRPKFSSRTQNLGLGLLKGLLNIYTLEAQGWAWAWAFDLGKLINPPNLSTYTEGNISNAKQFFMHFALILGLQLPLADRF